MSRITFCLLAVALFLGHYVRAGDRVPVGDVKPLCDCQAKGQKCGCQPDCDCYQVKFQVPTVFTTKAVLADDSGTPYFTATGKQCGWLAKGVYRPYDRESDTFGPACPIPPNAYANTPPPAQGSFLSFPAGGGCANGSCSNGSCSQPTRGFRR